MFRDTSIDLAPYREGVHAWVRLFTATPRDAALVLVAPALLVALCTSPLPFADHPVFSAIVFFVVSLPAAIGAGEACALAFLLGRLQRDLLLALDGVVEVVQALARDAVRVNAGGLLSPEELAEVVDTAVNDVVRPLAVEALKNEHGDGFFAGVLEFAYALVFGVLARALNEAVRKATPGQLRAAFGSAAAMSPDPAAVT
ncbi:MAG: hypothetical protein AAGE52_13920, partial [Myxococcota bacterium]